MKRTEILRSTDPYFIHHAEYTKELPVKNFTGAKYRQLLFTGVKGKTEYAVQFNTNSATFPGEKNHSQFIALLGLRKWLKNPEPMLMRDRLLKAISEEDLLAGCTCESFRFWGYAYLCTKKGIIYPKFREIRPPKVRNPRLRGIICKHLQLTLQVLPWNTNLILKDLKKKELEQ